MINKAKHAGLIVLAQAVVVEVFGFFEVVSAFFLQSSEVDAMDGHCLYINTTQF